MAEKLKARAVPYSSIVGSSVTFTNESGAVVVQIAVMVPNPRYDYRGTAEPFIRELIELWNREGGNV